MTGRIAVAVFATVFWAATPAEARTLLSGTPFGAAFLGTLAVPAHLLGLLAIGLWAGQHGGPATWQLPVAAVTAALAAALAAQVGVHLPYAGVGLLVSLVAVGAAVAAAVRVPLAAAVLVVAVAAVFHGYGHAGAAAAWVGFTAAIVFATAAGLGLVAILTPVWSPRAVQVCGGAVAVAGILDLAGVF